MGEGNERNLAITEHVTVLNDYVYDSDSRKPHRTLQIKAGIREMPKTCLARLQCVLMYIHVL